MAVLFDRNFGPYFFGKSLSATAVWVQNIAAAMLVFHLTKSALMVGLVSIVQFSGVLLLSLWAGALTDRLDRRRILVTGRAISATAVGALAVALYVRGVDGFGLSVVLGTVLVSGIGLAISSPAMHALTPSLVPADDLEQAVALNAIVGNIARAIGAGIGATLVVSAGYGFAFASAAVSHLIYVASLLMITPRPVQMPKDRPKLLGGLQYAVRDKAIGFALLATASLSFAIDPVVTLTPSITHQLGRGEQLVGVLASAFGTGAVLTSLFVRRIRSRLSLRSLCLLGIGIAAAGLVAIAFATYVWLVIAAFAITGSGFILATTALATRVQQRVPEGLRGRVMALYTLAFLGSRPVAAAVNGSMADSVSITAALLLGATFCMASSLFVWREYPGDASSTVSD